MRRHFMTGIWLILIVSCLAISCHSSRKTNSTSVASSSADVQTSIPYYPLNKEDDLDVLIKEIGEAQVVLLGESTHGTHEYYEWRTAITKRLIGEKGFDLIAVEGDWTDAWKINQFIKGPESDSVGAREALRQFDRWPSSMWGNYEMIPLISWLNSYNQGKAPGNKIAFYGLDVYSFWEWTNDNEKNIYPNDRSIQQAIGEIQKFFALFQNDALLYSDAIRKGKPNGIQPAYRLWKEVENFYGNKQPADENGFLLWQQALLALDGERYFRTLVSDRVTAINLRDGHMAETIKRLLAFHGKDSKIVVWAHNGHSGDAHYSSMGTAGYTSVAEILRKDLGSKNIFCVGFGTYKGEVLAGNTWNAPLQIQKVLPAKEGTWEDILHKLGPGNKIILSKDLKNNEALNNWIEFRSIGASFDGAAIYSRSIIPKRFDAFVFIDSTSAIRSLR